MNTTLELPTLGAVPRTWTMHRPNELAARTALTLLEAGHLDESHTPITAEPGELVKAGFKAWIDGNARGLKLFEFCLVYADGAHRTDDNKECVTLEIHTNEYSRALSIGRRICKLPREIAETVLYWIQQAANATLPIFTPGYALDAAMWNYWQGYDDESQTVQMLIDDGDIKKPAEYDGLTRAAFDKSIPHWASRPKKRLSMESIKALAGSRRSGPDVKVGRALFTLIGALAEYRKRIDLGVDWNEEPMLFPPPLCLAWRGQTGLTPRIYDDYAEDMSNAGEYRQHFARRYIVVGPKFERDLQTFLHGVEPMFPILRTLETLLTLITDRDLG